ncbi:potassium-transporting ATPase subunit C [Mycobacterium heckeshornense]|uniref:Potassium-transporting ATPase KdpC subunit n=1 Tax=Mycobacterium heckeshornense TaxID=110505 RepID=A0A2G8B9F7_9MYCO|nr:potassium-transporting ATPase subunit C [Mycobacterium heckeshornense]KMV21165.1 potassium ABC transporter ATPase [Mycobacterium heckeshornense]MCV7037004.1 potassium-transporting ATPase subunit C [Mycobacterium heckeshornense]PIJ34393.1 potassium-transporting ATPase subunit C [Mycobacterium heckeshornense]BCO34683.1 potassium-transporting ATPase KdpC subunit [Mycobacterium heckeshornense]
MRFANLVRLHWAALRALLVLTALLGLGYPVAVWLLAQLPGLHDKAQGSIIEVDGKAVGSRLIGQSFTDAAGRALPQYFQTRPSAAGDGYDPTASGASNLGPEDIVDTPARKSLLTLVCARSKAVGELEHVDGSRPFCTGNGVGAVLSVLGPRDARGSVVHPTRVVSVNEPCATTARPFVASYHGVRVECANPGENYSTGRIVPVRGAAPGNPPVPADAVTASGSGLDPDISPAYADIQAARVARARRVGTDQIRELIRQNERGRDLGIFGEPRVNVVQLNLALDQKYPLPR